MLDEAISYAARAHDGQWRKDKKTPYIAHPVRVMMILSRQFEVEEDTILAAAVMHDLIEDTTRDYENIVYRFGREVAELVVAMSKDPRLPEKQREAEYDQQLSEAPWQARLIKLADVLDNFRDAVDDKMQGRAKIKLQRALNLVKEDDPEIVHKAADVVSSAVG